MSNFKIRKNGDEVMVIGAGDAELIQMSVSDGKDLDFPIFTNQCLVHASDGKSYEYAWGETIGLKNGDSIEISLTNESVSIERKLKMELGRWRAPTHEGESCSLCFKPSEEVNRLIQGPEKLFVCNECVVLLSEMINEE